MVASFRPQRVLAHALYGPVLACTMPLHDTHVTETRVAVKCVSFDAVTSVERESGADRSLDDPVQEARVARLIMDTGGHRNVVQPICQLHQSTQLCLMTEFCDGGDLYTYASRRTPNKSAETRRSADHLEAGLRRRSLPPRPVVHRTPRLVARNVLISLSGGWRSWQQRRYRLQAVGLCALGAHRNRL